MSGPASSDMPNADMIIDQYVKCDHSDVIESTKVRLSVKLALVLSDLRLYFVFAVILYFVFANLKIPFRQKCGYIQCHF